MNKGNRHQSSLFLRRFMGDALLHSSPKGDIGVLHYFLDDHRDVCTALCNAVVWQRILMLLFYYLYNCILLLLLPSLPCRPSNQSLLFYSYYILFSNEKTTITLIFRNALWYIASLTFICRMPCGNPWLNMQSCSGLNKATLNLNYTQLL